MEVPEPPDPESSDDEEVGEKKGKGKTTGKKWEKSRKKCSYSAKKRIIKKD